MKSLIECIFSSPKLSAQFLNTLSLLEYIGARKILKSQSQSHVTLELLGHIQEEIRHAQTLKRAVNRILPGYENYHPEVLLCGKQACDYFQSIDHAAQQKFGEENPWHYYLYTTWLIETRATEVYSLCDEVLSSLNKPLIFRGILTEEEKHLSEVERWMTKIPDHEIKKKQLKDFENEQFCIFVHAVEQAVRETSTLVSLS